MGGRVVEKLTFPNFSEWTLNPKIIENTWLDIKHRTWLFLSKRSRDSLSDGKETKEIVFPMCSPNVIMVCWLHAYCHGQMTESAGEALIVDWWKTREGAGRGIRLPHWFAEGLWVPMGLVLGTHTICSMMYFFHGLWTRVVRFYAFSGLDLGFIKMWGPTKRGPTKMGGTHNCGSPGPTIVGPEMFWNKEMGSWEVFGRSGPSNCRQVLGRVL